MVTSYNYNPSQVGNQNTDCCKNNLNNTLDIFNLVLTNINIK